MKHSCRSIRIIALILVVAIILSKTLVNLLTEVWWFNAVGFTSIFWTRLTWQVMLWGISFVAYGVFLWGNYQLAIRNSRSRGWTFLETNELELKARATSSSNQVAAALILLITLVVAASSLSAWEMVLKYLHPTLFGAQDPIFQQDIGFYLFKLPLYEGVRQWLLGMILVAIALTSVVYLLRDMIVLNDQLRLQVVDTARVHLSWLMGALFLLFAWGFWLDRYHLLYSVGKVVFGAGYTEVHAKLLACLVMGAVSVGVAILFLLSRHHRRWSLPLKGLTLFLGTFVVFNGIYPWFVQQFIVNPNELSKEKPYIEHNINFTQAAYHLHDVQKERYAAISKLKWTQSLGQFLGIPKL